MKIRPLNSTALIITWEPPPPYAANGIITVYTVLFTKVETGGTARVERDGQQTALIVSSLHPYYHYSATISSNTSAGEGPFSDPVGTRLLQDGILINKNKVKTKTCNYLLSIINSQHVFLSRFSPQDFTLKHA